MNTGGNVIIRILEGEILSAMKRMNKDVETAMKLLFQHYQN